MSYELTESRGKNAKLKRINKHERIYHTKNDAGQRADKFITKVCPALPKSAMYKYIRKKSIKCNGKRIEISQKLCEGDVIQMYINDEFFTNAEDSKAFSLRPLS